MGIKVWSSWGVADQISKSHLRIGLQLNHAGLKFSKFTREFFVI